MVQSRGVNPSDIKGVGLSGQMHGMVLLDKSGKLLRSSIIWCDQRTQAECDQITELVGKDRLIEITANPALTGFTASKVMWVKNHQPELFNQIDKVLLPKDYIRYKLTGVFASEVSDAVVPSSWMFPSADGAKKCLTSLVFHLIDARGL